MTNKKRLRKDRDKKSDSSNIDTSIENGDEEIQNFTEMKNVLMKDLAEVISKDLKKLFKKEHSEFKESIQKSIAEIQESQKYISDEFDKFKAAIDNCSAKVDQHEIDIDQLKEAETRIKYLEQMQLNSNFVISNVVQQNNEKTEDLVIKIIQKLCQAVENMQTNILHVTRLKPKKTTEVSPILVRLMDPRIKIQAMKAINLSPIYCDDFGLGIHQQIYINHHLTSANQKILGKARHMKKNGKVSSAFYSNGYVYVRKTEHSEATRIISESSLEYFCKNK